MEVLQEWTLLKGALKEKYKNHSEVVKGLGTDGKISNESLKVFLGE
jgi:hypothetical protein